MKPGYGSDRRAVGRRLADGLAFLLFLLVPLAATPRLWDQFVSVKWLVLEALTIAWFLTEVLLCGSRGWPAFVRRTWPLWALLGGVILASCLRAGLAWGLEPLLHRTSFVMLVLCFYWYFSRNGLRLAPLRLAATLAAALTIGIGLAQVAGFQPLPALTAGDGRSALFGNVNMTAQFLGFWVLLWTSGRGTRGLVRIATGLLLVLGGAYLWFLACRSVLLAVVAALAYQAARERRRAALTLVALGLGGLVALAAAASPWVAGRAAPPLHLLNPEERARKAHSTDLRLAVWWATLDLVRDQPLGVGAGRFEDRFLPYSHGGGLVTSELLLFRSPHNDILRLAAEDGLPAVALAVLLGLRLWRSLRSTPRVAGWRSEAGRLVGPGLVYLAVEVVFQFPFGLAFGVLVAALLAALVLAGSEEELSPQRRPVCLWVGAAVLLAAGTSAALYRVTLSEYLFVNAQTNSEAQQHAARLNPRNLHATVNAAWLQLSAGQASDARRILAGLLRQAPYYYPAIKLLADDALAQGDLGTGCLHLWIYDGLFHGQSALRAQLQSRCDRRLLAQLALRMELPHYARFPMRLEDVLGPRDGIFADGFESGRTWDWSGRRSGSGSMLP